VALLSGQAHRADFDEYLYNRTFRGWKEAMWAAGLKLLTQVAEGKAVCFLTSDWRRRHARACPRTRRPG